MRRNSRSLGVCRRIPSSARERAVLRLARTAKQAISVYIVDTAGRSPVAKQAARSQIGFSDRLPGTPHRAFTLVECLTVIAVAAILLTICVPALHMGRVLAQRLKCQTNLRQLALAWDLYLNDEEGAFYQGVNANLDYGGWKGQMAWSHRPLNPYVGLTIHPPNEPGPAAVFHCPAERQDIPGTTLSAFRYFGTSYQTNTLLIGQDQVPTWVPFPWKALHGEINQRLRGLNRRRICSPAHLLLMGDYGWINQWMPNVASRTGWHGQGFSHNVVFLDGHVHYLPIRKGLYVTNQYTILPFPELHELAREIQVEELCPEEE